MPARVLVTGGAGMIGSNLVKQLVGLGHDVSVIDNLWRGKIENLHSPDGRPVIDLATRFHRCDLATAGSFEHTLEGIDFVYHLADVVAGIDYVFSHQGDLFHQNLLINSNVIAATRGLALKGFIYVGTACSYPAHLQAAAGGPLLREDDAYPANPESAYGWSKLMGEYETQLLGAETGMPVCVLRLHNVYGAPCDYDPVRGQVIPSLIRKAIRYPEEPFVVWGSGRQGRAFVLVSAMDHGLGEQVIQIGTGTCITIGEIAAMVVQASGKPIPITFDPTRPEGDYARAADFSRAGALLGWSPRVAMADGIRRLYAWIESDLRSG
jgi:GDP-D-mannose 3',5'-epimerase